MKLCIAAFLACAVSLAGCCGRNDSTNSATDASNEPTPAASSETSNDRYAARLDAALAIGILSERDNALQKVALDAADAGRADIVKKAVAGIGGIDSKANVTAQCALKLADADKLQDAVDLAKTIGVGSLRAETLKKLAERQ